MACMAPGQRLSCPRIGASVGLGQFLNAAVREHAPYLYSIFTKIEIGPLERQRRVAGQAMNSALFIPFTYTHQTDSIKSAFAGVRGRRAAERNNRGVFGQKMVAQLEIGLNQNCPSAGPYQFNRFRT